MFEVYKTLAGRGEAEIIERRSRFIASAAPCASEGEARDFHAEIKKRYKEASHNVLAFVTGLTNPTERQSDDGEPSGTAGAPALSAIKAQGLINSAVVVTRYFGGVLLGAGGLTRAYGTAAREGLLAAGTAVYALHKVYRVNVAYPQYDIFKREYEKRGYRITDAVFTENISLEVMIRSAEEVHFRKLTEELSRGAAQVIFCKEDYYM